MRHVLAILAILALATPALAAEETKPLEEVQALKIKVLHLERQLIQTTARAQQAEQSLLFMRKAIELNEAMQAAAKRAGVSLEEYLPDVEGLVWKKKEAVPR